MCPARCLINRARTSIGKIELRIAGIGIRLKDTAVVGQMSLWMFAGAVPGIVEHRRRRCRSAKWGIVPDICPDPTRVGLTGRQYRNRGIVAMDPFGSKCMGFDPPQQRVKDMATGPDRISRCRQADRHTFQRKAFDLAIEGNVLSELVAKDHRQKVRARPAPGDDMEWAGAWLIFSQSRQLNFSRTV